MEKLKSLIPHGLKQMVAHSTLDDLPSTSSSLLQFFLDLEKFHRIVKDLGDPESGLCRKNKVAALELKQKGNECYVSGDYAHALSCYTQALRIAPIDANDAERNLVATLYVNRASLLQKMDLLVECLRDCNRALQISPSYAKAWYRRGKVNASLGNYEDAIRDLTISKIAESSLSGKKEIERELKIILDAPRRTCSKVVQHDENNLNLLEEPLQGKLQCVSTPYKGRGMASQCDIPEAALVHTEEPYAAIISKHCRETHCHYCLNELPADAIPCTSCSIPVYCSDYCRVHAGGQLFKKYPIEPNNIESLFIDHEEYISHITAGTDFYPNEEHTFEHKHECQGAHWPIILPSDVALAGRILVKSVEKRVSKPTESLDLSHNYSRMSPESKLELHIYSVVLLYCLQYSYGFELPINGTSVSRIVILISQIRVNSMAIVRMKFNDYGPPDRFRDTLSSGSALTGTVEQVRVGRAIYKAGSLFNHSCQPNINAYFLSRTLIIRTTEFITSACPLELSYGPQVGQWDCKDRLRFLDDEYSFRCWCTGCSEVNISDLVINAFHCVKPNCHGVVLDSPVVNCEKQKLMSFPEVPESSSSEPHLQISKLSGDYINSVAYFAVEKKNRNLDIDRGCCLKCGSYRDIESSCALVDEAWIYIKRLEDAIVSEEISSDVLLDALRSLHLLRSILHAWNKRIAQAFCLVGDLQPARDHCKASIEILEKLYGYNHIAIGYELVKLSSIQISMGDYNSVDSINRLNAIFSRYYGPHADTMFPNLQSLKETLANWPSKLEFDSGREK